ncbi:hypothetical protein MSIMFB_04332 [Mycobacterium simulans]|uniref:WXG100 family type VII secretion target n=1 Tax=Mycobacterium simulans TaxID=627089 RepID=A0A7Z7NBF5_9MYCO|nr:hypothetical protein [Mycobacterium simulans]SOJ56855.1 hypothetical protein MSIMFB_04332 [Mycobacterium simulans]
MAAELRAIPELLCHVGNELANHGESLLAVQQSCHSEAAGARSGWVGSSAGALLGLLDRWATDSITHIGRFGEHSRGMHFAAAGFAALEQRHAAALAQIATDGGAARSAR